MTRQFALEASFLQSTFFSLTFMEALRRISKVYVGDQQSLRLGQQTLRGRETQALLW